MEPQTVAELAEILTESPNRHLLEIEIGCGNGHFITHYAHTVKSLLVGIDVKKRRCLKALGKVNRQALDNVHIACGRAEELLSRLPCGSVARFHIYFPDPWPKTKHRRRRFFRKPNMEQMLRCLEPGGLVHFASDVFDYYVQAKIVCILQAQMRVVSDAVPEAALTSLFSKRIQQAGRAIHGLTAVKYSTHQIAQHQ